MLPSARTVARMGLTEKFLDRIKTARSIEELERVGEDLSRVHGLTDQESATIRTALNDAFDQAASLDTSIDNDGPQVVKQLHQEAREKDELKAAASTSLAVPRGMELTDERAEATIQHFHLFDRIKEKLLNPREDVLYIGPDGRPVPYGERSKAASPYIRRSGWLKLAHAFGVDIQVLEWWKDPGEDDEGSYYVWSFKVRAVHHDTGRFAEAVGAATSRDPFFSKKGKQRVTPQEKDIRLKSQTVAINRAIAQLIGGGQASAEEAE